MNCEYDCWLNQENRDVLCLYSGQRSLVVWGVLYDCDLVVQTVFNNKICGYRLIGCANTSSLEYMQAKFQTQCPVKNSDSRQSRLVYRICCPTLIINAIAYMTMELERA